MELVALLDDTNIKLIGDFIGDDILFHADPFFPHLGFQTEGRFAKISAMKVMKRRNIPHSQMSGKDLFEGDGSFDGKAIVNLPEKLRKNETCILMKSIDLLSLFSAATTDKALKIQRGLWLFLVAARSQVEDDVRSATQAAVSHFCLPYMASTCDWLRV